MLRHLHIEDYALIDRLDLELHPGFNLLTGETGSGKSIVVDAVALLLGDKASPGLIRSGADRARIAGVFAPSSENPESSTRRQAARWNQLGRVLEESGIEAPPGEDLILQRDIQSGGQAGGQAGGQPGGRSRLFINNQPATVSLLKSIAPLLAEVHGQNEQQELFLTGAQLDALDRFGNLAEQAESVRERFERWRELRKQLETLSQQKQEGLRQMDLWRFQQREIEQANAVAGEDERLEDEKRLLAHAERIQSRLAS
ncbi:MAG TPA: AAA family ATPase, partial [Terriglobia bacterium]